MAEILLNLADLRLGSRVNGPGARVVVWVQGCRRQCPGCFNPHTHEHQPARLVDPGELGQHLATVQGIDGLTLTGGEPFEQAEACRLLIEPVRAAGRTILVFTGYTLAELQASSRPEVLAMLALVDLLIAGPYRRDLPGDGERLLGSANQQVHDLRRSDAGPRSPARRKVPRRSVVELRTDGQRVEASGFPAEGDLEWVRGILGTMPG